MAQARSRKTKAKPEPADQILEAALELAEQHGWDQLRLHQIADRLKIPMAEVLTHFRDQDAIADAWFGRGLAAMLAPPPEDFESLPVPERLHLFLMRWFDALAPHQTVTGQMLRAKLYPSHPHHWVPLVFNLSRTVQWWRDAARLNAGGGRKMAEEIGLTALFLTTLAVWLNDTTENQERTRRSLERRLSRADRLMAGRRRTNGDKA